MKDRQEFNFDIFLAARYNNFKTLSLLIKNKADPNNLNDKKETPLMEAAYFGSTECVKILLEAKADIDRQDKIHGKTALMWAVHRNNVTITKLLLEAGANLDLINLDSSKTIFNLAFRHASFEIINLLLSEGAIPETPSKFLFLLDLKIYNLYQFDLDRAVNLFLYQQDILRKNKFTNKNLLLENAQYKHLTTAGSIDFTLFHQIKNIERNVKSIIDETLPLPAVLTEMISGYDNPTKRAGL